MCDDKKKEQREEEREFRDFLRDHCSCFNNITTEFHLSSSYKKNTITCSKLSFFLFSAKLEKKE